VEVSAILDFTQVETTTETFVPIENGERSTLTVEETFLGDATSGAANVPGAIANIPGSTDPDIEEGGAEATTSDYSRIESTINNELNRTIATTSTAPGTVQELSISVILDESISEEQAADLQQAVAAAAGVDAARGDSVTVTRISFDTSELEAAAEAIAAEEAAASQTNMIRMAIPVLAVLLAAAFFFLLVRKLGSGKPDPSSTDQLTLAMSNVATALPAAETVDEMQERLRIEAQQVQQLAQNKEVATLVQDQSKAVAEVIQTWVRDDV
jgi:flagellar M-ring protein FliF